MLRALAAEFPGALRELQKLPPDEVARRRRALERTLRTGRPRPWMAWLCSLHARLRAALSVKRRLGRRRDPAPREVKAIAAAASRECGTRVDAAFVRAIASCRDGRLDRLAADMVAREVDVPADRILEMLRAPQAPRS